jgi:hypothetical protein
MRTRFHYSIGISYHTNTPSYWFWIATLTRHFRVQLQHTTTLLAINLSPPQLNSPHHTPPHPHDFLTLTICTSWRSRLFLPFFSQALLNIGKSAWRGVAGRGGTLAQGIPRRTFHTSGCLFGSFPFRVVTFLISWLLSRYDWIGLDWIVRACAAGCAIRVHVETALLQWLAGLDLQGRAGQHRCI